MGFPKPAEFTQANLEEIERHHAQRLKPLLVRLGMTADFGQYVALLRAKYKAKRNFIKLLDKLQP